MRKCIAAWTSLAPVYPGYVNFSHDDDGSIIVSVRGDPTTRDGAYICGYERDKGQPGRCTPGDAHCNNYCNKAPQKGPMADRPKPCTMTNTGETVMARMTAAEFAEFVRELRSAVEG
jgi:hypothetical protein